MFCHYLALNYSYSTFILYPLGSECMVEFMKMQKCFARYPKLYNKNNHSNKINEKESNIKPMNHPEARRHRMNEAINKNNH
jgi:hypothetical protein